MIVIKLLCLSVPLFVFVAYLTHVELRYGKVKSVSASYYVIKRKPLFTTFCWLITAPLLIFGHNKPIFIAGVVLVGLIGAFVFSKGKWHRPIHLAVVITGIALIDLSYILELKDMFPLILSGALSIPLAFTKRAFYFIEIVTFLNLIGFLLFTQVY